LFVNLRVSALIFLELADLVLHLLPMLRAENGCYDRAAVGDSGPEAASISRHLLPLSDSRVSEVIIIPQRTDLIVFRESNLQQYMVAD
jgi:hypothetical protein